MVWSFFKQLYEFKFWGLLLVLALSNLAGTVGGFDTTGEASCEDCEQTLLSGISLFPVIIDLLEQGPEVEVVAEIEAEEGADWSVRRKSSSSTEDSDFVVDSFTVNPAQGKTTTLTFTPTNGMFRTQRFVTGPGQVTSQTIETKELSETFRVIALSLGETKFPTNNRWLRVRGHNPHVRWLPGPSIGSDALVLRAGSAGSSLIQVFDSSTESWTGWTVSVIPSRCNSAVPTTAPRWHQLRDRLRRQPPSPGHGERGRRLFRFKRRPYSRGRFISPAPDESGQKPWRKRCSQRDRGIRGTASTEGPSPCTRLLIECSKIVLPYKVHCLIMCLVSTHERRTNFMSLARFFRTKWDPEEQRGCDDGQA